MGRYTSFFISGTFLKMDCDYLYLGEEKGHTRNLASATSTLAVPLAVWWVGTPLSSSLVHS